MAFYQEVGLLVLGSRLKKTGEKFLQEVTSIYKDQDIHFETGWFPFFYLLEKHQQLSISKLSETLGMTHSGCSQMVMQLQKKGYVVSKPNQMDARRKDVTLTEAGHELTIKIRPIWKSMVLALENEFLDTEQWSQFIGTLQLIEEKLSNSQLYQLTQQYLLLENNTIEYKQTSVCNDVLTFMHAEANHYSDNQKFWIARNQQHLIAVFAYDVVDGKAMITAFELASAYAETDVVRAAIHELASETHSTEFYISCRSKVLLSALLETEYTFTVQ